MESKVDYNIVFGVVIVVFSAIISALLTGWWIKTEFVQLAMDTPIDEIGGGSIGGAVGFVANKSIFVVRQFHLAVMNNIPEVHTARFELMRRGSGPVSVFKTARFIPEAMTHREEYLVRHIRWWGVRKKDKCRFRIFLDFDNPEENSICELAIPYEIIENNESVKVALKDIYEQTPFNATDKNILKTWA